MSKIFEISKGAFYKWLKTPLSKKDLENNDLLLRIKIIHQNSKGTYGSPRITAELRKSNEKKQFKIKTKKEI